MIKRDTTHTCPRIYKSLLYVITLINVHHHRDGYSIDELNNFISIIHGNLLTSMVQIIKAMDKLNITLHNLSSQVYASKIISYPTPLEYIPSEIGEGMKLLWQDDDFQECLKHAVEYQLSDSALYYFERMNKILEPSYIPTQQDVLQSRVCTTGMVETSFKWGNTTLIYAMLVVNALKDESGFIVLMMSRLCCLWQH